MTTEEAAKEYFEHRFRALDGETQREEKLMCGIAYRVLRQKTENNDPLTLDELREMDGEPVWVIPLEPKEQPEWALVDVAEEWLCTSNADYWGFEVYGRCILAYRRKPEEG